MISPSPMPPLIRVPAPFGPEDVVIAGDGTVYSAARDTGRLLRVLPGADAAEVVAELGGKGLGVELMADGRVLVCNAELGLQAVDPATGTVESLVSSVEGRPFGVCNNAGIARDGTVYFTESSRAYPLARFRTDIVEDTRSGRLLRWRPGGEAEVVLDGLAFANGVAVDPGGRFVLVAQTGASRIERVDLSTGKASLFTETPGFPDNLSVGSDGLFWVAIPALPNPALARIHGLPKPLRRVIARLPEGMQPAVARCCRVAAYRADGTLAHLLDGDPGTYHHVTGVRERDGTVWLGSIFEDALARFTLPRAAQATTVSRARS